jgi:hypothetical protein
MQSRANIVQAIPQNFFFLSALVVHAVTVSSCTVPLSRASLAENNVSVVVMSDHVIHHFIASRLITKIEHQEPHPDHVHSKDDPSCNLTAFFIHTSKCHDVT